MLTYHYQCLDCQVQFTAQKRISDPPLKDCPTCGNPTLRLVLHAVEVIDTTPRTLGAQADKNYAKAGAYERQARHQEIDLAKQRAKAERLPEGMESVRNPSPQGTWWRPGEKQVKPELVRADPATKRKYLEQGKL